jgi:hypothetical protein
MPRSRAFCPGCVTVQIQGACMKNIYLFIIGAVLLVGCAACYTPLHEKTDTAEPGTEPVYEANVVWEVSGVNVWYPNLNAYDDGYMYVYGKDNKTGEEKLIKINVEDQTVVWSLLIGYPSNKKFLIDGDYIYNVMLDNTIICVNKNEGKIAAKITVDIENQDLELHWNLLVYENYLYVGIGHHTSNSYFVRIDMNQIDKTGDNLNQFFEPEILWRPQYNWAVASTPAVYESVIYVHTFVGNAPEPEPVELAGFNVHTKERVFYEQFGVEGEYQYELGRNWDSLLVRDGVLYVISDSISAYNLQTGKRLYLKKFYPGTPPEQVYYASDHLELTYYKGKIYYTNINSNHNYNRYRNIFCVDAATGNLVWSAVPPDSESLWTNPIAAYDRVYVPHGYGFRVYDAETGKLLGVDKNFEGNALCRNILYGDYMITVRGDALIDGCHLVAVYVGE